MTKNDLVQPPSRWLSGIHNFLELVYSPPNLKILSGLEFDRAMIKVIKAGLATVIMITVGDYCSVTPGKLQISTTNKNSRPEN